MAKVMAAGAVVFRRERGEIKYLLLYHGRGYWNFPKGRLEQGERAMAAFFREVEEETGLKRSEMKLIPNFQAQDRYSFFGIRPLRLPNDSKAGISGYPGGRVMKQVIYYLVETAKREVGVSEEHEGFAWFPYPEAIRHSKYANTKSILKRADEFIRSHIQSSQKHPQRHGRNVR